MDSRKILLGIFIIFGVVIGGIGFSQAEEQKSKVIENIVEGYKSNLEKIKDGYCVIVVTSTGSLPEEGQTNHYKATHLLKFTGPYLRWEHMDSRKVTSVDGKIIKEIKGPAYDTYIDKEEGICYGYIGENRYEIRSIDSPNMAGDPKTYRIMPQNYGKPISLLRPKGITHKFIRYEDVNGHHCALIEARGISKKWITVSHIWVDTESYLILKERDWMQYKNMDKKILIYETELEITLCDRKNNLFGPKVFKEIRYIPDSPDSSTGKSKLWEKETVKFENLIYNLGIKKEDLIMAFPQGAKVHDWIKNIYFTAGKVVHGDELKICMSNLKLIGLALHIYAKDHNKKFPDDLKEIYTKRYVRSPEVFWCPADTDPKPTDITNSIPNNPNSCQISYTYYPGHSTDEPNAGKIVIMEDNSPDYHNGSKNILFLDGHCELQRNNAKQGG